MIIAIDGPMASGKSTVSKMLARELGFDYLYTGLIYRAVSYILVKDYGYSLEKLSEPTAQDLDEILHIHSLIYRFFEGSPEVLYKGQDITSYLKNVEVDDWSSRVSVNKVVREKLVAYQRAYAQNHDIVVEGRDIGTVVFPHADYKFFLTASIDERARRWQKDQMKYGHHFTLQESIQQVEMRDGRDMHREISPLQIATRAIVIDATKLSLQETVGEIKHAIQS